MAEAAELEALSDKLGVLNYHRLKKFTKSAGVAFLQGFMLSEADKMLALTLCKGEATAHATGARPLTVSAHRRTVMWICGASLRQIAFLDDVTAASVQQSIRRHLSPQQRTAYNIRTVQVLTPSQVSAVDSAYKANEAELSQLDAVSAADRIQLYIPAYLDD